MKLFLKTVSFIALCLALNAIYTQTAFQPFMLAEAEQFAHVQHISNNEVIYVSESSNFANWPDKYDDPHRNRKLSEYLADFYPSVSFEAINQPTAHAGVFKRLLNIVPQQAKVKTVIVAMNLRSFNAYWINSIAETTTAKANVMYNHRPALLNRLLVSLNAYDIKSNAAREAIMHTHWEHDPLPLAPPKHSVMSWCAQDKFDGYDDPRRGVADQFIKQYAFVINEENQRVKDFDAIVATAKDRNWNLIFSILPENMEMADSLVGPDLTGIIESNVAFLKVRYAGMGIQVIDNLTVVPSHQYTDQNFPTEHYNDRGRKRTARNIARHIQHLFPDQYRAAAWDTLPPFD